MLLRTHLVQPTLICPWGNWDPERERDCTMVTQQCHTASLSAPWPQPRPLFWSQTHLQLSRWRSDGCLKFSTSKAEILISLQIHAYHQLLKLKIWASSLVIYFSPSSSQHLSLSLSLSPSLCLSYSLPLPPPPLPHPHSIFGLSQNSIIQIFTICHPLDQKTIFPCLGGLFTGPHAFAPGP